MLGKIKWDYTAVPTPEPRVQLTTNLDGATAAPSPARALQMQLELRTAPLPDVAKWSARRRLAFIVASASTLWLAIIGAGATAVHAIA